MRRNVHIHVRDAGYLGGQKGPSYSTPSKNPKVGEVWIISSNSAYARTRGWIEAVKITNAKGDTKHGDPAVYGKQLFLDEKTHKVVETQSGEAVYEIKDLYRKV